MKILGNALRRIIQQTYLPETPEKFRKILTEQHVQIGALGFPGEPNIFITAFKKEHLERLRKISADELKKIFRKNFPKEKCEVKEFERPTYGRLLLTPHKIYEPTVFVFDNMIKLDFRGAAKIKLHPSRRIRWIKFVMEVLEEESLLQGKQGRTGVI